MRSDGSGRGRRSYSSSRGGHGAERGGRGPQPGLQAAERLEEVGFHGFQKKKSDLPFQ